jgi:stage II sporulation protein D
VRIALFTSIAHVTISGTGPWRMYDTGGASTLLRDEGGDLWTIVEADGLLRAVHDDGSRTAPRPGPFVVRPAARGAFVTVNGKPYRGEVWILPLVDHVLVLNRLYLEDYLKGVVPMEIGNRAPGEEAAVRAQAVAARSYAYTHLDAGASRPYDMVATVMDQVYGGVDAETPMGNAAVDDTRGLVLRYAGHIVNAPYHSTCGGSTAAVSEVWSHSADEPYLVPVSDQIPGTDRYYCDISPRFRWIDTLSAHDLQHDLARYLRTYAAVPRGIGRVRTVQVSGLTPTGRVSTLDIVTTRGRFVLHKNDIRFVLRSPGGEILNSTYFSVDVRRSRSGMLTQLMVHGGGYGHGIGMCQWGAIGRARAGQDYRTILATYYPGTVVAPAVE